MFETFMSILVLLVVVIFLIIAVKANGDYDGKSAACDFDCERCPFPKCDEEQIRRMKDAVHNGRHSC